MSIQTTTPTSPTFNLNGCNSSNYNSIITSYNLTEGINNNCEVTNQVNPYLRYQQVTNEVKNMTEEPVACSSKSLMVETANISPNYNNNSRGRNQSVTPNTKSPDSTSNEAERICTVCGDHGAKMHYNVLSCLGCKGFFRRALKRVDQYECINDNKCIINKDGRNSCRSCRLRKCLVAGMDPSAVRPDRDGFTKKGFLTKASASRKQAEKPSPSKSKEKPSARTSLWSNNQEEWSKKLPVEMRTMLMNLLNTEIKITRGDTLKEPSEVYPLHITIKEVIENPSKIRGKRTEMRYEPYRMAKNEELCLIVYRRVLAAIDWVEYLAEMVDGLSNDDKIALVKSCFAPLLLFKCSARTAMVTETEDILCLSNFAYVPRNIAKAYTDTYHLDNGLVERLITELVKPFRKLKITEEEVVCLSAIIVLNPMAKDLSEAGIQKVSNLRDKIQDTLYQYIKESRTNGPATCLFGNFLLYLPLIANLSNALCENIRFAQTFSTMGSFPLLTSVFGCFPVEPLYEADGSGISLRKNVEVQTDPLCPSQGRGVKRRLPSHFVSPVENDFSDEHREFRLLQPPCSYTLTEMFEDRMNDDNSQPSFQMDPQMTWPPRIQQMPSTSQATVSNFANRHYALHSSGSSKQLIGPRHSFNSSINTSSEFTNIPHQNRSSKQQPQSSFMGNTNPTFEYTHYQPQLNHQASYPTFAPPPIENLTFEHREKTNN